MLTKQEVYNELYDRVCSKTDVVCTGCPVYEECHSSMNDYQVLWALDEYLKKEAKEGV